MSSQVAGDQRLLVSVRGPTEAVAASKGGAQIVDVEYPASALGTPYPLNILAVRNALDDEDLTSVISTNIGETQHDRAAACQAALGVATAGAELIKFGLATLPLKAAQYQGETIVRTVRNWFPDKKAFPAVFVDPDLMRFFDPFSEGPELVLAIDADGLLIDTFNKAAGQGLLDFSPHERIGALVEALHAHGKEAWVAGSISQSELPSLWELGVDVICVRGAACDPAGGSERFGEVSERLVRELAATIPA